MPNRRSPTLEREALANENLWRKASRDSVYVQRPSIQERREHIAVSAFVKGPHWYAVRLLKFQAIPGWRLACRALIQNSRRLLEESRHAILKTKNTLAFSSQARKRLM